MGWENGWGGKMSGVANVLGRGKMRNADFPHKAKEKWATDLNATLPQDTFSCYFQNIHKCTISTKLRDFQYRLLNQAVITNTHLFKWKIIQTDLCTFCEEQPESILHLLVKCKHSQLVGINYL